MSALGGGLSGAAGKCLKSGFKRQTATHPFVSSYGPPGLDPHGRC